MSRSRTKPVYGVTPHGNRESDNKERVLDPVTNQYYWRTKQDTVAFVEGYVRKRNKGYVCWVDGNPAEWYWRTEDEFMRMSKGVVGKRLEPRAYMVERMKLGEIVPVYIRKSVASYRFG